MKNNDPYSPDGNGGSQNDCQEKRGVHTFVEVLAVNSKWLFSLAVIGTGLISAVLFIYGFILSISAIFFAVIGFSFEIHAVQEFLAKAIEIIDIFLVATVFYLISMGLFELLYRKSTASRVGGNSQPRRFENQTSRTYCYCACRHFPRGGPYRR